MLQRVLMSVTIAGALALLPSSGRLEAKDAPTAKTQTHAWMTPGLLAKAKAEGKLVVYSSTNEQEGLPLWKLFTDATGIKVNYVRASDTQLLGRIELEARARQRTWDLFDSTAVEKLPHAFLAKINPPEAKNIIPQARDPQHRWYGIYSVYNSPAYNTKKVKASELPKTYAGFLKHKEWAGHVAIDSTDDLWLSAIYSYYGDDRAEKLIKNIVATLKPILVNGHLALARSVGLGDYWISLNNFDNLTLNVKFSGAPIDYWGLNPIALFFGELGVSANAPHPNAARLAANFLLSKEAQTFITKKARVPVRKDVATNPPDEVTKLGSKKIIVAHPSPAEEKVWLAKFQDLFKAH